MAENEDRVADLAGAILDGSPIDWRSAESGADSEERSLLESLKLLAALADLHRNPSFASSQEQPVTDRRGELVGVYRLVEPLGRGGMGEVYLAQRADGRFEQTVAVKLIKRGMDSVEILRRFARERRILAGLHHPGIARLLDGGETEDGRPYFVMERVEGEPITDYARARKLSLEDRLRLVASCCDAVDAAHRGLVVHRDLKPSNILVTRDGEVKLLDFGIAKLISVDHDDTGLTRQDHRAITPPYAAPEQILGGNVTMATDVFALGVVLYELLTGAAPFDRRAMTAQELITRVERESAQRPSSAAKSRRLRGDLDTITMKALAREPERRYHSAAALGEDLRRYLTSRPVEARPDSRSYRLRKFSVRHRSGLAAAAVVAAAVFAALIVSLHQTAAARREAERAAATQAFLTSLFEQIDPDRYSGSAPTVRDLLERGSERLDRELVHQPEVRSDMEALLGQVFDQLSLSKQGEANWRRALATRQVLFGPDDARTLKAKKGLAISIARQARFAEAEPLFKELLVHPQVLANPRDLGSVLLNYGNHKRLTGDYVAAERLLVRAVAVLEGTGDRDSRQLASALNNLGLVTWKQGRPREAAKMLEQTLAIHMKNLGPRSSRVATTKTNLCLVYREFGELDTAQRYGEEALAVNATLFPPNHPSIAWSLEALGKVAQKRGDRATARALYERAIATYEGSNGRTDAGLGFTLSLLARLSTEEGKSDEALRLHERALTVRRKVLGENHVDVGDSWENVGRARLALSDSRGALEAARSCVSTYRSAGPAGSARLPGGLLLFGDLLRRDGRAAEALPYLEEANAIWSRKPPTVPKDRADLDAALAATRAALR